MSNQLRPTRINDLIGQEDIINNLKVSIASVKARSSVLQHCLFYGGAGLGDNQTVIGNSSTTNTTIYGTISAPDGTFGAIMENNVASPEVAEEPEGTILIWEDGKPIPSYKEYDYRVLGVVKEDSDKPIVLGAEPVLVTGVISEGDFIVTSDKRGHGKKGLSNNMFGKVIGQALESGEGDSYVIKAMVRKL